MTGCPLISVGTCTHLEHINSYRHNTNTDKIINHHFIRYIVSFKPDAKIRGMLQSEFQDSYSSYRKTLIQNKQTKKDTGMSLETTNYILRSQRRASIRGLNESYLLCCEKNKCFVCMACAGARIQGLSHSRLAFSC